MFTENIALYGMKFLCHQRAKKEKRLKHNAKEEKNVETERKKGFFGMKLASEQPQAQTASEQPPQAQTASDLFK